MPTPQSICLEFLEAEKPRYVRCVALSGAEPGLAVGETGEVLWMVPGGAFELWISADEQLILRRLEGSPEIEVRRSGRNASIPVGKPTVILDQDSIHWAECSARVHVHGEATTIHPPQLLKLAAGLALTMALQGADPPKRPRNPKQVPIEIRATPPSVPPVPPAKKPSFKNREIRHWSLSQPAQVKSLPALKNLDSLRSLGRILIQVHLDPNGKALDLDLDLLPVNPVLAPLLSGKYKGAKDQGIPVEDWITLELHIPPPGQGEPSIQERPKPK